MSEQEGLSFSSSARLTSKKIGIAPQGTLALADGRLMFTVGPRVGLDVALGDLQRLRSPWFMLGAGFVFETGGTKYSCTFNKLIAPAVGLVSGPAKAVIAGASAFDLARANKLGRAWMKVLSTALSPAA